MAAGLCFFFSLIFSNTEGLSGKVERIPSISVLRVHSRRPMTAIVQWKWCGCTRVAGNNCPKGRVYVNYASLRPNVFNISLSHFLPFHFRPFTFTRFNPLALVFFSVFLPSKSWVKKLLRMRTPCDTTEGCGRGCFQIEESSSAAMRITVAAVSNRSVEENRRILWRTRSGCNSNQTNG